MYNATRTGARPPRIRRFPVVCPLSRFIGATPTSLAICWRVSLPSSGNSARPVSYTHLDVYKRQILGWLAGPLMQLFMKSRTESGAEFFFVGVIAALVGRVGVFGLILFELSRLRGFEREGSNNSFKPNPLRGSA